MAVLRFLAARKFNRFDVIWLVIATMAANHFWRSMLVILVGAFASVFVERLAERTTP